MNSSKLLMLCAAPLVSVLVAAPSPANAQETEGAARFDTLCIASSDEFDGTITCTLGTDATRLGEVTKHPVSSYSTQQLRDSTPFCRQLASMRAYSDFPQLSRLPSTDIFGACSVYVTYGYIDINFGGSKWVGFGDPLENGTLVERQPDGNIVTLDNLNVAVSRISCDCYVRTHGPF
jgi:hypothetical protein